MEDFFKFERPDQALRLQKDLSVKIVRVDDENFKPRFLCGIDVAYENDTAYVAAAIWDASRREFVGKAHAMESVSLRYVSGFLGFREGPLLVGTVGNLLPVPDVLLVDGQGFAHPRRFGLACHVGLAVDMPTLGVAKSRLYGEKKQDSIVAPNGEVIGRVITAGSGKKFYVSVGHRISLETACKIVEGCIVNNHPAPLREAHLASLRLKGGEQV